MYLALLPSAGSGAFIEAQGPSLDPSRVLSVRASLAVRGFTTDRLPGSDLFGAFFDALDVLGCTGVCKSHFASHTNIDVPREWYVEDLDVTALATDPKWKGWKFSIGATESFANRTYWDLDSVALTICTGVPTPSPTATRTPAGTLTPTPVPTPGCFEALPNASFERGDLSGWKMTGEGMELRSRRDGARVYQGEWSLFVFPDSGKSVWLETDWQAPVPAGRIKSAAFFGAGAGASDDLQDCSDHMGVYFEWQDPGRSCGSSQCSLTLLRLCNDDVSTTWKPSRLDVARFISDERFTGWRVQIYAKNSFVEDTVWDVDGLSINVCTK